MTDRNPLNDRIAEAFADYGVMIVTRAARQQSKREAGVPNKQPANNNGD